MEKRLPAHQYSHAPVASGACAPRCRRAGDDALLPAHLPRNCGGTNMRPWLPQPGLGPESTADAPAQGRAGGNSLLPARPWPGASAVLSGPGPHLIQPGRLNTVGVPTSLCTGSNLGTYFCQQPLLPLPLLQSSHTTRAFSQPS
jgi:hypothetical protein